MADLIFQRRSLRPTRKGSRYRMRQSFLLTFLLCLVFPGVASAACLLTDYSTRADFLRSKAVLVGRVLSERDVPGSDDLDTPGGTFYLLKVLETLRGAPGRTVEIFSENSSARFPMRIGTSYLLFLYKQQGVLSADYCGNSGPVANKADVLRAVRQLAKHEPSP
jgi:hypothetical protein